MSDDIDLSPEYIDNVCRAAPFADNDAGIPQMVALIRALSARLAEVEAERNQYAEGYAQTLGRKWNADDALIRAALEVASRRIYVLVSNEGRGFYRRGRGGYSNGIDACHDAIREMMDDPGELARIKARAGEGRT
jgi:hypothetical protein